MRSAWVLPSRNDGVPRLVSILPFHIALVLRFLPSYSGFRVVDCGFMSAPHEHVIAFAQLPRYFCRVKYAASYNPETDTFQHLYLGVGALGLVVVILVVA